MKQKGYTAHDLARLTEVVYETIRKAITGQQPPSKKLLRDICSALDIEFEEAYRMLVQERLSRKHGDVIAKIAHKNPEIQPIEKNWALLTPQQKQHLIWLVEEFVQTNLDPNRRSSLSSKAGQSTNTE